MAGARGRAEVAPKKAAMAMLRLDSLSGVALSLAVLLAMATVEARQLGFHRGAADRVVRLQGEAAGVAWCLPGTRAPPL